MTPGAHIVEARLQAGWRGQDCVSAQAAAAMFDRLRRLFPSTPLRRLENGRVVEVADGSVDPTVA